MTVEQIVSYMRLSMSIQDPDGITQDSAYLSMTDEDIELYLTVCLTRDFPDVPSLEYLPTESVYPLTLLARKDLFYTLAVKEAPLYDIGADNNNYLKRSQRFDHYMELIVQADKEYQDYLDNGGAGGNTVSAFNVLLTGRYNTRYNYENGVTPAPVLYVKGVSENSVDLEWKVSVSRFFRYRVYLSESQIVDLYTEGNHISKSATLATSIRDIHQNRCRIEGLSPSKEYHAAVEVVEMSGLRGYSEVTFTTLGGEA